MQLPEPYLAEVHLVKDNLVGMADTPEPSHKSQNCDDAERNLMIQLPSRARGLQRLDVRVLDDLDLRVRHSADILLFAGSHIALPHTSLRRGSGSHDGRAVACSLEEM